MARDRPSPYVKGLREPQRGACHRDVEQFMKHPRENKTWFRGLSHRGELNRSELHEKNLTKIRK